MKILGATAGPEDGVSKAEEKYIGDLHSHIDILANLTPSLD